jgi:CBS domain-containing protein
MNMIVDRTPPCRVADYMSTTIRSVDIDATVKEAGELLEREGVGCLLVQNGSRYIGIVTDTDLSRKAVAKGLDPTTTTVNTCMTKPLISLDQTEGMSVAIELMKEHGIRHLGVTQGETVIGILSASGVVRYYSEMLPVVQNLARLTTNTPGDRC